MTRLVVVGGGISALSAAYFAHRAGLNVTVIAQKLGGVIQSVEDLGYQFERGPNTFPSMSEALMSLCESLNLQPVAASGTAKKRYLYYNGQLQALPGGPLDLFTTPLLSLSGKLKVFSEPLNTSKAREEETVAQFITRRLGPEVSERFVDPFVSGIYAGDAQQLSMQAVFPKLVEWEQTGGSLVRGAIQARHAKKRVGPRRPYGLYSLPGGLHSLMKALQQALPVGAVHEGDSIEALAKSGQGYRLTTGSGQVLEAEAVILATPAPETARLLAPMLPDAAQVLKEISYAPIAAVPLGFQREAVPHALDGFGFLIPRSQGIRLLGAIWSSTLFPERAPEGHVLMTCMMGGATFPEIAQWRDEQIISHVLEDLRHVFKAPNLTPAFSAVAKWTQAIPQYTLGHLDRSASIESAVASQPGLALAGNYLHGVSMNDCVLQAQRAVGKIQSCSSSISPTSANA